jgi:hypothetical protein
LFSDARNRSVELTGFARAVGHLRDPHDKVIYAEAARYGLLPEPARDISRERMRPQLEFHRRP